MAVNNFVNNSHGAKMYAVEVLDEEKCSYPGCRLRAAEDANECEAHRDRRRERVRRAMQKKRARWESDGRCVVCGRQRAEGSSWGCRKCDQAVNNTVNKADRIAANSTPRTSASNLGRTHYHGQNKRGPMSRAAANRQALESAAKALARALEENEYVYSPEVEQLPKIQRLGERRRLQDSGYYALRWLAAFLMQEGVDVAAMIAEMVRSLRESET